MSMSSARGIPALETLLRIYEAGGRVIHTGPAAGDGRRSPLKSGFVAGFRLSDAECADLLTFLHALTDPTVGEWWRLRRHH
jgi:cytochrome c peroxidase